MEIEVYYIYHIPTFIHKNGRIGKIGCTEEVDAKVRVNKQGYTDYEILETHTDIMVASDREIQLQKEYGYPVDTIPYYKSADKRKNSKGGKIQGKIQGKKNVESGHLTKISSLGGKKGLQNGHLAKIQSLGGKVQGKKNAESGHLKRIAQLPNKRTSGKIWITDGVNNKMIMKEDKIDDGWKKGKTQKRKI